MSRKSAIDVSDVRLAYRRWAPVYDITFGKVADAGRRHTVKIINRRKGSVLEVGVGTGLSLPHYSDHLNITGIDLSTDMLEKARERAAKKGLENISGLYEMDASALDFPDGTFDTVVAMYVMTVVPSPERVMSELERVCAPGGEVIVVNHFSQDDGVRGWIERRMAPLAATLGWHPVFDESRVMGCTDLNLTEQFALKPLNLFTMMRFVKRPNVPADHRLGKETTATGRNATLKPAEARGASL